MEFLRACASRLDAGESADGVMADLRERYKTIGCVNVKACLVRRMCTPSREHTDACRRLVDEDPELAVWFDAGVGSFVEGVDSSVWTRVPSRYSENVRRFTITRDEVKQCKRLSAQRAIVKNKFSERVHGRTLLAHARAAVDAAACADDRCGVGAASVMELALSLMLLTGRRECEILNGKSVFEVHTEYSLTFHGQAKKRGRETTYTIPVLHPTARILCALRCLRGLQKGVVLSNRATSLRYQSHLGRHLASRQPWHICKRVHSLRGIYTCMSSRLFDWGGHSDAFVAMCILGHSGLTESLVYTPFHMGVDFSEEPGLGEGHFTPWTHPDSEMPTVEGGEHPECHAEVPMCP